MTAFPQLPCDRGVILAAPRSKPCAPASAPWILAATVAASAMAFIDGTMVNVALPALQHDLQASLADVQWVVEAYALLLAALLLAGGAAGDRYGRRRIFLLGVVIFAVMSAWCGLARGIDELIAARAGQGIGAALLVPGSLSIIGASFAARERGRAVGLWSGATAITGALGPLLGGWLIDHLSWRAAFFLNVPLAIFVVIAALRHIPESRNRQATGPLDWPGALLATLGLSGLVYGLIEASTRGWTSAAVLSAIMLSATLLGGFTYVEARHPAPMVPLTLFRSRTFLGANLLTLLLYAALGGSLFFVPLNLIQVQGYSATAAGAALLPFVLLMALLARWSGGLIDRHGAKLPLMIGPLIAAAGFALFALPGNGDYWVAFFPAIVVLGLGMAITVAPLTTAVLNAVDRNHEGSASGINNAASRISVVIAIALFGVLFTLVFDARLDAGLVRAQTPAAVVQAVEQQRGKLAAIDLPANLDEPTQAAARHAIHQAFIAGYRWVMLASALLALLSSAIAWRLMEAKVCDRTTARRLTGAKAAGK